MTYLNWVWAITRKDLLIEIRTRERVVAMAAFAVLVGVLFNYSFDPTVVRPQDVASGLIWMTIVFSGILGMGRTFKMEDEDGAFEGMLLAPIPRDAIFLGKVVANFVVVEVVVILVVGMFGLFFRLNLAQSPLMLAGVLSFGTLGFVALTTLFSAISARSSMGETLLPVLVFPLLVPLVIYGASATARVLLGRPFAEVEGQLRMLGAFALVGLLLGAGLFRFIVED